MPTTPWVPKQNHCSLSGARMLALRCPRGGVGVVGRFKQEMQCDGRLVWQATATPVIPGYGPGQDRLRCRDVHSVAAFLIYIYIYIHIHNKFISQYVSQFCKVLTVMYALSESLLCDLRSVWKRNAWGVGWLGECQKGSKDRRQETKWRHLVHSSGRPCLPGLPSSSSTSFRRRTQW